MAAEPGQVFYMSAEPTYLDDVDSVVYDYGDRVEVLVGAPSEMQLPVDQGIVAAYAKACHIAEACGYVAYLADGSRLVLNLHTGSYVLFWDEAPGREHLLASITCADTVKTERPRDRAPELWAKLGRFERTVN